MTEQCHCWTCRSCGKTWISVTGWRKGGDRVTCQNCGNGRYEFTPPTNRGHFDSERGRALVNARWAKVRAEEETSAATGSIAAT